MDSIEQNTESYYQWIEQKEELLNRYFDFDCFGSVKKLIKEIYTEPKVFLSNFLEIGITDHDEKLCMCIEDNVNNGRIFPYGWKDFYEYYTYDQDGNEVEYHQEEVYGFQKIAESFEEFLQELYVNG